MNLKDMSLNESKEIIVAVSMFKALEVRQLAKLIGCDETKTLRIIKSLCKNQRLYHKRDSLIVSTNKENFENPDAEIIKSFWVFLQFQDKSRHYSGGDYPILVNFFSDSEHYEIVSAKYGGENIFNHMLSDENGAGKRLVVIEEREQIEKIDIPNLLCYCMVSDDGIVEFFKKE